MRHRFSFAPVLALAALALGTGCTRTTDFSLTEDVEVTSAGGGVVYTIARDVDLSKEAGLAWSYRDHVTGIEIAGIDATITAVHSGGPTTGSGSIVLSRNGTDVTVGRWTGVALPTSVPHSIAVTLDPAGAALLMDALHGDGKLTVQATASTAGAIAFAADVTLHASVTYRIP